MFLTNEAVRLPLPGQRRRRRLRRLPPLARLFEQDQSSGGELVVCPI